MKRNDVFSLILKLAPLDNLFNLLLFLAGILFIIPVIGHHRLSLILCLQSSAVIAQPRPLSATPGHRYPSPAVPSFSSTRALPSFHILVVCVPPAVFDYTLLSSYTPCSPPHNPGHPPISPAVCLNSRCHISLYLERPSL